MKELPIVQRLRDLIRQIEQGYPALRAWLGDRLDLQIPAIAVSLMTHLTFLLMLGMIGYAAAKPPVPEFESEFIDTSLSDFAKLDQTEIIQLEDTSITPVAGSFAPETRPLILERPPEAPVKPETMAKLEAAAIQVASVNLPQPARLDSSVQIKGSGAEHVDNVEGAVDRVAVEILRRLEKGRTLVVWAFDASGSLVPERKRLAKYIDKVYAHIEDLDRDGLADDGALLTAVVAFGKDRKVLTKEPTTSRKAIAKAISAVHLDESGIESTFRTVTEIANKYGKFSRDGESYQPMTVIVTDEVGDDQELLETAIQRAQAAKMPIFVLGSAAVFGQVEGYMDYTDPKTGYTWRNLPLDQGPESAELEGIKLPFWYDGPQYDQLDAGFGPYALTRLAGTTGGIYFITRLGQNRITFDPAGMREYKPDWDSHDQYMAMLRKNPLRRAVMRAGIICQQNLPPMPSMTFPPIDAPNFKNVMTSNQEKVARVQYTVDEALGMTNASPGEPTIINVAKYRDHEPSRRWQAHYDLIRGRLMVMKIRCMEYNLACARMKRDAPKFTKPESNAWRLVPDEQIHISDKAAEAAEDAMSLLDRVIKEHPGTPWALLAQRERKDPLGLTWVEVNVPPPPKPGSGGNDRNNAKPSKPKPPPPKL